MFRALLVTLFASFALLNSVQAKEILISGSSSVTRVMDVLAEKYNQKNPEHSIAVQGIDSTAGIILTIKGVTDIGMSSRYLIEKETSEDLQIVPIAYDGIAIATNNTNPVSSLSIEQLKDIYLGKITNWKQVGGKDEAIAVVTREIASGSRYSFETLLGLTRVIKNKTNVVSAITNKGLVVNSNGMMKTLIAHNPQAIGYVSMGSVDDTIKSIKLDNVEPTSDNIINNKYALYRPFLIIYKKEQLDDITKSFLDYLISDEGQAIIKNYGYTPTQK